MSNSSFPDKEQSNPTEDKNVVRPDFILIDEREGQAQKTYFKSDSTKGPYDERIESSAERPISMRLACFFGIFLAILFAGLMLVVAILMTFFGIISLFSNKELNEKIGNFWGLCFDAMIVACCLVVGIVSPAIGFSLIALYFSLLKKSQNYPFFQKIKNFFNF